MEEFSSELILQRSSSLLVPKRIGFGYLPVNILVKIFGYFDEDEIRTNIIKVCQQWRQAAENPSLWNTLKFQGRTIDTDLICNKIWQFRNVSSIVIKTILDPVVVLRQICRRCEDLTSLVLRNCPEISEDALRYLLVGCQHLQLLDLKGTPFQALILFEELPHCHALISINLGSNPYLNIKNVQTLAMNSQHLSGFHLGSFQPRDKVHLNDGSCYFILTKLVHNLTHLSLDCSTLSACTFASILRCKHLEYLCLNYAYNFRGCDFQNMWKTLTKLKVLKVRNGHLISEINCSRLFTEGQDVMRKLKVIDFTGCGKIANGSILAISKCCKNIKGLIIKSCRHISTIDALIENCPELEMLNIGFCVNIRFDALPHCLRKLFISDNIKHRNFAIQVMQQCRNCKVRVCLTEFNKETGIFFYG